MAAGEGGQSRRRVEYVPHQDDRSEGLGLVQRQDDRRRSGHGQLARSAERLQAADRRDGADRAPDARLRDALPQYFHPRDSGRRQVTRVLASALAASFFGVATGASLDPQPRRVYVAALDGKGSPVTDLSPADFLVKEGGKARDVIKADPAIGRMQIAILV